MVYKLGSSERRGRSAGSAPPAPFSKRTRAARKKTDELRRTQAQLGESPESFGPQRRVEVLETYFGADGKPIKRKSLGAARVARRYDERGNKVEESYFNADGKPTLRKDLGVARIAWRYDERGNEVEAAFFGADGKRIDRRGSEKKRAAVFEDA